MRPFFDRWRARLSLRKGTDASEEVPGISPITSKGIFNRHNLWLAFAGLTGLGALFTLVIILVLLPTLPSVENIAEGRLKVPMRVYTAEGRLLGEFGEERRIPVAIAEVPKPLIGAILATEDSDFYDHWGVNFKGILRAAIRNLQSGSRRQGASTITMQVARNFFLSPERTWARKIKEALLAFKIERALSKDEILELYFNKIFLGHRSYGFAAAAQIYYGKSLTELTLSEMAMLAGLPKAPSRNNPISNPDNAIERRNYVLERMHKLEFIEETTMQEAQSVPITASKHRFQYDVKAPYVAEMVRQYMYKTYAEKTYAGGFHVHTTIRADYQETANKALHDGLMAYDERHGYRGAVAHTRLENGLDKDPLDESLKDYRQTGGLVPARVLLIGKQDAVAYTQDGYVVSVAWDGLKWAKPFHNRDYQGRAPKQTRDILKPGDIIYLEARGDGRWRLAQIPEISGAIVSLRPDDGAILALTGGFDFQQSKFNRVTQAERQPGSNIKPFVYSAALNKNYTAASLVNGAPIVIDDKNLEGLWKPENYSGKFVGPTRLRLALTKSINTVSVRLLRAIGSRYTVKYLERFGFPREKLAMNLSLVLGNASLKPIEMVSGFAVFANGGFHVEPYFIAEIKDAEGNILERANPTQVCPECPETEVLYRKDTNESPNQSETVEKQPESDQSQMATPVAVAETPSSAGDQENTEANEIEEIEPRYAPRVITPENTFIMTTIMRDIIRFGTGRRAWWALKRGDLAGKTGTTNEFRDAWFSGFNRNIVTTIWVGFDQPSSLGLHESGAKAALPIWIDFMRVATKNTKETVLEQPETVVAVMIDPETGRYIGPVPDDGDNTDPDDDTDNKTTDNTGDPVIDLNSDDDDIDSKEPIEKKEPIQEYFIAGTEPGRVNNDDGTTSPAPTPKSDGGLEGLF